MRWHHCVFWFTVSSLLALPLHAADASGSETPLHLETVAPGVHAALQTAALRFRDANSVLIFDPAAPESGALVVDLPSRAGAADWWVQRIGTLAPGPVRFLVNTHWHSDHTQSNARLKHAADGVTLVGAESLRQEVPERAAAYLTEQIERMPGAIAAAEERLAKGVDREGNTLDDAGQDALIAAVEAARQRLEDWQSVTFLTPDLTYPVEATDATDAEGGPVTLHIGSIAVELHPFRGHTRGDTVLYLPAQKILLTGDLLDDLPYGGHGYLPEWIAALETLQRLDFQTFIPGHGPIYHGEAARLHLDRVLTMFRAIHRAVHDGLAGEKSLEAVQQSLDLAPHRAALAGDDPVAQRAFDSFIPETVERAYRLAKGEVE